MKKLTLLLFSLCCLALASSRAQNPMATTLDAERYTDVGGGNVRFESGTLFLDGSYVPFLSRIYPASQYQLDAATLAQVSGQPVVTLNFYLQASQISPGYLDNFPRSSATYSISSVPYVIVSAKAAPSPTPTPPPVPGLPAVTLTAPVPQVAAGSGQAGNFLLSLSAAQLTDTVVSYTVKGTATNGTDYALLKGTAKIKAGKTARNIKVIPEGNLGGAAKKVVKLTLAAGSGYTVGTASAAKVKIVAGQ